MKTRGSASTRGSAPKIAFKPKAVQRRKKDGASDSLLSLGAGDDDEGPSDARLRRADRGRGRGRGRGAGRVEAPLVASGPFAQGPAAGPASGRGRGASRSSGGGRLGVQTQESSGRSTTAKREKLSKEEIEEEANLDDTGKPMQNLLRLRDTSDFWAPISTERIERSQKEAAIAQPGQEGRTVKVKKEAVDMGFIDVKTEPSESTLTSRVPTPEPAASNDREVERQDSDSRSHTLGPEAQDSDDDDIALPGAPSPNAKKTGEANKAKIEKKEKKEIVRVMTAEEAEEQERLSADLESLRLNLSRKLDPDQAETEQLIFIQLPEVLPFWKPGADDGRDDGFIKEEEAKEDIVEIDQKAEDSRPASVVKTEEADDEDILLPDAPRIAEQAKEDHETGTDPTKDPSPNAPAANGAEGPAGKGAEAPKKKKKKQKPVPFPPPEGLLGQLHVHRSGRISCTWGGITMDVGTGSDCGFLQEVVAVDTKTDKKAWSLGRVNSRVIMSPSLDDLLGTQG